MTDKPQPAEPQQASELVERVTQADRDAALNLLNQQKLHEHETGTFRCWDKVVKAFAAHRRAAIAALTPDPRIKALEDEVERLRTADFNQTERLMWRGDDAIRRAEAAEAALATARADVLEEAAKVAEIEVCRLRAMLPAAEEMRHTKISMPYSTGGRIDTAVSIAAAIRNLATLQNKEPGA